MYYVSTLHSVTLETAVIHVHCMCAIIEHNSFIPPWLHQANCVLPSTVTLDATLTANQHEGIVSSEHCNLYMRSAIHVHHATVPEVEQSEGRQL